MRLTHEGRENASMGEWRAGYIEAGDELLEGTDTLCVLGLKRSE